MIEVLAGGLISSVQDTGRPGSGHLGIGRAGAADPPALQLANALVGNVRTACGMEVTLRGPRLRLHRDAIVALTGASLPHARCNGEPLPMWQAHGCPAGSELDLGAMAEGCRSYLAISGGIDVAPWLGSRSSDLNARVGPMHGRALKAGDRLPVGESSMSLPRRVRWSLDPRPWFDPGTPVELHLLPGTHTSWLDADSLAALGQASFRVGSDSNRVGARLQGPALRLSDPLELVSEGVVAGVMQLPPGGQPIVLLNEHPVTGGYPRIAQLAAVDLPRLAQCRPGDMLRFSWITLAQAQEALRARDRALDRLLADIAERLRMV